LLPYNEVFNIFENDFACLADDDAAVGNNAENLITAHQAGGLLRTTTPPTFNRRTESARLYEHSP